MCIRDSNAPWPVCEQTMIVRGDDVPNDVIKRSKKICDKVLNEISNNRREEELDQLTIKDILDSCEVTQDEYDNAMNTMQKSATIHYKRQPNETMISPYNTVLLSVLKANIESSICYRSIWTPYLSHCLFM